MPGPLSEYKEIILARAVDDEIQSIRKSSGGAVTAIFTYLLEQQILDGVVYVESREGLEIETVIARNREEMLAAAESDWPISPSLRMMNEAIADNDILNCGVIVPPCQAEGIRLMQEYPMTETNIERNIKLIVGSFCYGTFTQKSFKTFLKEKKEIDTLQVQRVGITSDFLEITLKNGEMTKVPAGEVLLHIQSGCLVCQDLTAVESDISAGVIPTTPRYTTLIVRTDFGAEVVKGAVGADYLEIAPLKTGGPLIENMIKKMAVEKIKRAGKLSLML